MSFLEVLCFPSFSFLFLDACVVASFNCSFQNIAQAVRTQETEDLAIYLSLLSTLKKVSHTVCVCVCVCMFGCMNVVECVTQSNGSLIPQDLFSLFPTPNEPGIMFLFLERNSELLAAKSAPRNVYL